MKSASQVMARWAKAQTKSALPADVEQICVRAILDTIGVAIAGCETPQAMGAREYAEAEYGSGSALVIGGNRPLTPRGAAFANAVAAHALDFDDTCYAGICHGSAVILPAVLASAQSRECSGAELIRAFAIGSEIAYMLGHCLGDEIYFRGWFTTSLLGSVGAAAGVAAILGSDEETIAAAIANALTHGAGARSMLGSNFKPVMAGQAAAFGVESACLAKAGLCAAPNALEHRFGIAALTGANTTVDQSQFTELGQIWRLAEPGLAVKLYPVCSAAQAAIEAVTSIVQSSGIDAENVASIDCEVPELVAISLPYRAPKSCSEAQFSLPFCVACALVHGGVTHHHLKDAHRNDDRIERLIGRVSMRRLDDTDPLTSELHPEGARVTITMANAQHFEVTVAKAYGMPERPLSDDALDDKFRACVAHSGVEVEMLLRSIRGLPKLNNATDILVSGK